MTSKTRSKIVVPEGYKLIFRRFRKDKKTGQMLDAGKYGIKAWPILVEIGKEVPA